MSASATSSDRGVVKRAALGAFPSGGWRPRSGRGRRGGWLLSVLLSLAPLVPARAAAPQPAAPFHLCVLDQTPLLQRAQVALREAARFQQLRQQAQARIDADRVALDADDRALVALQSSIAANAYAGRKTQIDARRQELAARTAQLNTNLAQLDTELTNRVMRAATPFIAQVEHDRGCSVLAAKSAFLAVNDPGIDITDEVIRRMNAAPPAADPQ